MEILGVFINDFTLTDIDDEVSGTALHLIESIEHSRIHIIEPDVGIYDLRGVVESVPGTDGRTGIRKSENGGVSLNPWDSKECSGIFLS